MHSEERSSPLALDARRVAKTFATRRVLDLDGLSIMPGEIHALLGQNGSGKSTFIKILAGFHSADDGPETRLAVAGVELARKSIDARRASGLRIVHQDLGLVGDMSVLDNLYLGRRYPTAAFTIRDREAKSRARAAVTRAGLPDLDLDRLVRDLAPAERTGVAVARALASDDGAEPRLLVLDEPTATLPAPEAERLLGTLSTVAASGVGVLYVTHHLDEVFAIADSVTVLRDGLRVVSARTTDLSREELVVHLVGAELDAAHRDIAARVDHASQDAALEVARLSGLRLDEVSFSVRSGEIVGFYGLTGSGRDTLLGTIAGRLDRTGGHVTAHGSEVPALRPDAAIALGMAYVPSDRRGEGVIVGMTAAENIFLPSLRELWRRGRIDVRRELREAAEWFQRLDVRPADAFRRVVADFSGGNQQKIVLAKWLRKRPAILLLDDPTQGVDVGAKAMIHRTLLDATSTGLAVAIASSDAEELVALCTTVHVMHRGRIAHTVSGAGLTERELDRQLTDAGRAPLAEYQGDPR